MAVLIEKTEDTEMAKNHNRSLSKINPPIGNVSRESIRPTEYFVGLYSINKRRMPESPYAFIVENAAYKQVCIPTCPSDKRYIKVMDIPHPVQTIEADPHNMGEVVVRVDTAKRVAMSIINPDVIGHSMEHLPARSSLMRAEISWNCDLINQGIFFTTADEGTPDFERVLLATEDRMAAAYRRLLDGTLGMSEAEVRILLSGPRGLDLRTAAEHFGEDYSWTRRRAPKIDCPNCFDKIPQGAAFHKNELLGVMCVLDWRRAVEAGVKTKDQVPEGKEWWLDESAGDFGEKGAPDGGAATPRRRGRRSR